MREEKMRILMLYENRRHAAALERLLAGLHYEVVALRAPDVEKQAVAFCPLAVLEMPLAQMEPMLALLQARRVASKILALLPFEAHGGERRLVDAGADDVLTLPVTAQRLEITLRTMPRLYHLEKAGVGT
jgi:DNA-binding response OmpR family regulator